MVVFESNKKPAAANWTSFVPTTEKLSMFLLKDVLCYVFSDLVRIKSSRFDSVSLQ